MVDSIRGAAQGIVDKAGAPGARRDDGAEKGGFEEMLMESIEKVNILQKEADRSVEGLVTGRGDIHETMIAVEKADLTFNLMVQVRNKLISAYEEIMRMQV